MTDLQLEMPLQYTQLRQYNHWRSLLVSVLGILLILLELPQKWIALERVITNSNNMNFSALNVTYIKNNFTGNISRINVK